MMPAPYRVVGKRREMEDTWTLDLEPADGDGVGAFAPGQFSMLYAFAVGEVPISVSGDPSEGGRLTHTVRAVGAVSRSICGCEPGDSLGVRGPFGTTWPVVPAEGGDVVVVAGGVGLAPLHPVLAHLVTHRERYGAVALLYGARSPREILFEGELDSWRQGGIDVEVTVDSAPSGWPGRVGLVTALLPTASFDASSATAMVCGPEVMMSAAASALLDRGVRPEAIHLSLERNMKCAIGHCGHCQLGHRFICKDGPVFAFDRIESLLGVREL